jgi:hypothetical protein
MESNVGPKKQEGCKREGRKLREVIIERDKTERKRKEIFAPFIAVACKQTCL